jgi:hypothetical protein
MGKLDCAPGMTSIADLLDEMSWRWQHTQVYTSQGHFRNAGTHWCVVAHDKRIACLGVWVSGCVCVCVVVVVVVVVVG